MIQILTVKDEKDRKDLCQKAGIEYSFDLSVIASHNEDGQIDQGAIFRYNNTVGEIFWIEMGNDFDLAIGLGKSILSIMELRGVQTVSLPLSYEKLGKALRFQKSDDHYLLNLDGYFNCCCQHK